MNRIREWLATGASVSEISQYLNIEEAGVKAYVDSLAPKEEELSPQQRGALTRAANKAAEEGGE